VVPCLPHLETLAFIAETKFASRKAKIIKYFLPNSETFDKTNNMTNIFDFALQFFPVCPGH
jgi:radical SAM superfamily enzyme